MTLRMFAAEVTAPPDATAGLPFVGRQREREHLLSLFDECRERGNQQQALW